MAYSNTPDSQTFATQVPLKREAGERVFKGPVSNEVPTRQPITSVAAAGSTSANAAVLAKVEFQVVTGADTAKGVRFPVLAIGESMSIHNQSASTLKVYPPTGGKINGGSTDAAVTLAANTRYRVMAISATELSGG